MTDDQSSKTPASKPRHRILKRVLVVLAIVLVACVGGFLLWASDYYHADATAVAVEQQDSTIEYEGDQVILPADGSTTALIFYPGAKVEATAYLPILEKIRQRCGITCILVKMPLNLAILDKNAADGIIASHPEISTWFIGGHSMGGAMASAYASAHQDELAGLVLLGAYVYGDYPPADALTIYGTFNSNLEADIHYTDNVVVIEGGNHAQFGNYGRQSGDPDATISANEQQDEAVDAIAAFVAARE